jgi:hypothetical protein
MSEIEQDVRIAWGQIRVIGPNESAVRDIMETSGSARDLSDEQVLGLLREVGELRRAMHPVMRNLGPS